MNRLGDDLNIDQAWAEYESVNRKKKKYLWIYLLPFILIAVGIIYNFGYLIEDQKSKSVHSSYVTDHNFLTEEYLTEEYLTEENLTKEGVELESSSTTASSAELSITSRSSEKAFARNVDADIFVEQSNTQPGLIGSDSNRRSDDNLTSSHLKESPTSQHSLNEQNGDLGFEDGARQFQNVEPDSEKSISIGSVKISGEAREESTSAESYHIDFLKTPNIGLLSIAKRDLPSIPGLSLTNQLENVEAQTKWNIGLGYEYAHFERRLTGPEANYIQRRNLTEKLLESNRINFSISRFLSSRFYISSGLSINQYRTRIDNRYTTFTSIIVEDAVVQIIKTNNAVREVKGPTSAILIKNSRDILYQRYLDLSIPISLGYRLPVNNRFGVDISMGLAWSPFIQVKGKLHESYFSINRYKEMSELGYRTSGHFQGLANVRFLARVNRSLEVYIGGQYRRDISNRLSSENSAVDRFKSGGVTIGINMNMY